MIKLTTTVLVTAVAMVCCGQLAMAKPRPGKLTKVWESDTTLRTPESVLYDQKENVLYVSNIDGKADELDGSGFISKVSLDGTITNLRWTSGLNAPKGMGIHRNRLYVTDVYRLVAINLENGQAEKTWDATPQAGAFLNDVTVDKDGTVYVSDNRNNKIYRLKDDKWEIWMEGEPLGGPNGLLAVGTGKLLIGSGKRGSLQSIDLKTKAITKLADGMAATDGIEPEGKKNYFVSDWNGQVFHVTPDGKAQQVLDTRAEKVNSADIAYVNRQKLLIVPTFFKNKLVAYKWE